jgi:anti-sigma regulatory factor (Ser/Thr protein kinase)
MRRNCPGVASATWSSPALADEVGSVRHAAVEFAPCRRRSRPPSLEDLRLAIAEAVTNGVVHAFTQDLPGTVTITVDVTPDQLVEAVVRDDGMGLSSRRDSPGRRLGLGLIASVADTVEQRVPGGGVDFNVAGSAPCTASSTSEASIARSGGRPCARRATSGGGRASTSRARSPRSPGCRSTRSWRPRRARVELAA